MCVCVCSSYCLSRTRCQLDSVINAALLILARVSLFMFDRAYVTCVCVCVCVSASIKSVLMAQISQLCDITSQSLRFILT